MMARGVRGRAGVGRIGRWRCGCKGRSALVQTITKFQESQESGRAWQ
jgi:hypothetical protein